MEKIFEPFYTTKPPGKGTGLGLSSIFGIVQQHQGHIFVDSEPGKGTIFTILLPRADCDIDVQEVSAKQVEKTPCTETILIVDDSDSVLNMLKLTLESVGYTILKADSGDTAMEIINSGSPAIDMVLTDVVMPGMNGPKLVKKIREVLPDIKVAFMSGYPDEVLHREDIDEKTLLITKPIIPTQLELTIRKILDN